MFGNLFFRARGEEDLRTFATRVFATLNIAPVEIRQSDNYAGGEYAIGRSCAFEVTLSRTDDDEFRDYPFGLSFCAAGVWVEDPSFFDDIADLTARFLTIAGFEVVRALEVDKMQGRKVRYCLRPERTIRERVSVETFV